MNLDELGWPQPVPPGHPTSSRLIPVDPAKMLGEWLNNHVGV
jgi:hypothetical protein